MLLQGVRRGDWGRQVDEPRDAPCLLGARQEPRGQDRKQGGGAALVAGGQRCSGQEARCHPSASPLPLIRRPGCPRGRTCCTLATELRRLGSPAGHGRRLPSDPPPTPHRWPRVAIALCCRRSPIPPCYRHCRQRCGGTWWRRSRRSGPKPVRCGHVFRGALAPSCVAACASTHCAFHRPERAASPRRSPPAAAADQPALGPRCDECGKSPLRLAVFCAATGDVHCTVCSAALHAVEDAGRHWRGCELIPTTLGPAPTDESVGARVQPPDSEAGDVAPAQSEDAWWIAVLRDYTRRGEARAALAELLVRGDDAARSIIARVERLAAARQFAPLVSGLAPLRVPAMAGSPTAAAVTSAAAQANPGRRRCLSRRV